MKKLTRSIIPGVILALVHWLSPGVSYAEWCFNNYYPECYAVHNSSCDPSAGGPATCWWGQACEPVLCYCQSSTNQFHCYGYGGIG